MVDSDGGTPWPRAAGPKRVAARTCRIGADARRPDGAAASEGQVPVIAANQPERCGRRESVSSGCRHAGPDSRVLAASAPSAGSETAGLGVQWFQGLECGARR